MRYRPVRSVLLALLLGGSPAGAQVPRELPDLQLDYAILLDEGSEPIGTCRVRFERVEGKRGSRLRVSETADYTLPLTTPWRWQESVEVLCDENGVEKFEATTTAGEVVKKHVGLRRDGRYHVTSTVEGGETTQREFPDDVRRSNLGMFCGAFLVEPLDHDDLLREFPMLWPSHGTRYPRQKFRESILPFRISEARTVRAIVSTLRKDNKIPVVDRYYHVADELMILLRWVQETDVGVITYELTAVDGVPLAESERL